MAPKVWQSEEIVTATDLNIVSAQADDALKPSGNLGGLLNKPAARTNLDLGNSSTRDVGTTAGTVAAGDDIRLFGEDSVRALLISSRILVPPTPVRAIVGAETHNSAKIYFDVGGTDPTAIDTAGVDVSPNSNMSSPVYSSADTAPTVIGGYYVATFTATGLSAATTYYWRARVNGDAIGTIGTFKTKQTAGTAGDVTVIIGSCTNRGYALGNPYQTFAPLGATQFIHIGDIDYSDIIVNSLSLNRSRNLRYFLDDAGAAAMAYQMSLAYTWGDHDGANNDSHWDKGLSTGVTHNTITGNALTVYKERMPHYPLWNSDCIGQHWQDGRVKFIMPDMYRFARYEVDEPTFFGTGSNPPSSYDQRAKLFAEIAAAGTDNAALVVLLFSATLYKAVFGSMEERAPEELALLYDAIRDCPVQCLIVVGDAHQLCADDGDLTDFSSSRDCRAPYFVTSALNYAVPFNNIVPTAWDGVDGNVSGAVGNSNGYLRLFVDDGSETNVPWEIKFYGAPLSGTSATLLATYAHDDIARTAGFSQATDMRIEDGENAVVTVEKLTGWGICSVDYAWASGPSGTATFLPNRTTVEIARTYTDGAPDTLTLSNPVGCTLGATTVRDLVYFTPETEAETWRTARSTPPSASMFAAVNDLIVAAKAASLWTKLVVLGFLAEDNATDALTNIKTPGTYDATITGTVGFAPLQGFRGGSVTGTTAVPHLERAFAYSSGYSNDHCFGLWALDYTAAFGGEMGGDQFYINPYSTTASDFRTRSASTTSNSLQGTTNGAGSFMVSRTGSTNYKKYINGSAVETVTQASAALTATEMWECGFRNPADSSGNQSGARRIALTFWASGFSDADVTAWHGIMEQFLTDLGAI